MSDPNRLMRSEALDVRSDALGGYFIELGACSEVRPLRDRLADLADDPAVSGHFVALADDVEVLELDVFELPIDGQEVAVGPLAVRIVRVRDVVSRRQRPP